MLLPDHESLTVDFKSEWNERKDGEPIKKTLVAFANTAGGDLYIGVDDEGNVVGLTDPGRVEEKLASAVRDNISPSLVGSIATEQLKIQGKSVLRVHVDAGPMKPYCLDPKTASGIYIRLGNTSSPASLDDITRMVRANNPTPYESRLAFNQNLTFDYCMAFCRKRDVEFDPKHHLTYGFWNAKQAAYTNLAAICSDQSDVRTVMIEFADDDKTEILTSDEVTGSIFQIYTQATDFLTRANYARMEKPSRPATERIDHYFVDPRVVMEALVNMLAHRDYSLKPANLIHVTPSAIEIHTVGGLVEGLSVESIVDNMSTECRNKQLAHLLGKLKLMENRGSGFRLIRRYYKDYPLESLLRVSEVSFTIRLPINRGVRFMGNERYRTVLDLMATHPEMTRKAVQSALGLSQSATVNLLNAMVKDAVLEVVGGGRSTMYRIRR